jgi:hypothetical protein
VNRLAAGARQDGRAKHAARPAVGSAWSGDRVEDHRVAEAFELGDQPAGVRLVVAACQPVRLQVLLELVTQEHVVGRDEHGMGDRDRRTFHPPPAEDD